MDDGRDLLGKGAVESWLDHVIAKLNSEGVLGLGYFSFNLIRCFLLIKNTPTRLTFGCMKKYGTRIDFVLFHSQEE